MSVDLLDRTVPDGLTSSSKSKVHGQGVDLHVDERSVYFHLEQKVSQGSCSHKCHPSRISIWTVTK